ncbi:retromer complex subunit Vps17 [Schizosaccharomyces japonicus yFS275]|uniref:Retromer complex subunit Vps17 n=1 Tax=Schizosaccharomyces japonicus (strain yFS275 / FY16936) TaxID=402676 RepID=B6JX44_SCHJY|nr:retromer complex subunit Vps17 [Schizosaccharomyces japonicus yFS275]EEB05945.2 retromer complex subunit Vps17 [Schizosaccharomyces japonicus yFS275]
MSSLLFKLCGSCCYSFLLDLNLSDKIAPPSSFAIFIYIKTESFAVEASRLAYELIVCVFSQFFSRFDYPLPFPFNALQHIVRSHRRHVYASRPPRAVSMFGTSNPEGFMSGQASIKNTLFEDEDGGFQDVPISGNSVDIMNSNEHVGETVSFERHPSLRSQENEERSTVSKKNATSEPKFMVSFRIASIEIVDKHDPILKMNVTTNCPGYRSKHYRDVRRTYGELCKLARYLTFMHPECLIPAVPPSVGSAGSGSIEDNRRLKESLQSWLDYVGRNPYLVTDTETKLFVESDFGYSPLVHTANPTSGLRRKALKQLPTPPDHCSELANLRPIIKAFYRGTLDAEQKLQKLFKSEKGLIAFSNRFAEGLQTYSQVEPHTGLSRALSQLGKTLQHVSDSQLLQTTSQLVTFGDPLAYASSNAFVSKEILSTRHMLMRDLIAAQSQTNSALSNANRVKQSTNISKAKVDEAVQALADARTHEKQLSDKLTLVTSNLLRESKGYIAETTNSLSLAIDDYVRKQCLFERKVLASLEAVRPHIRRIDPMGGLSRLGREGYPQNIQSSSLSSQRESQDAWSGRARSNTWGSSNRTDDSKHSKSRSLSATDTTDIISDGSLDPKSVANILNGV